MNLADHPNESLVTMNDQEARALLAKEGLLEKLDNPGVATSPLPDQIRFLLNWNHPTHWIQAIRFFGFKSIKENGYIVRCFAKSQVTRAQFEKQMEIEKKELFDKGSVQQINDLPPTGNN